MTAWMASHLHLEALPEADAPRERAPSEEERAALETVATHVGPVIVDLDETLYLRNSTEDYLDGARPRVVAALLLRVLDVIGPWRWTGGASTRDVWRVRIVSLLLPWIDAAWRQRVALLAARHVNVPLREALLRRQQPFVVATDGFQPIVAPLVQALGLGATQLVACALTPADRRRGKVDRTCAALGEEAVATSLVLTDSPQDQPLLDACRRPLLLRWQGARYRRALADVYLPGDYISRVKHPGEHYAIHGILLEDFPLWFLAAVGATSQPLGLLAGLTLLLFSFWTIYERGYVDNDRVGERFERDPVLSRQYFERLVPTPALPPWIWAAAAGVGGVLLLEGPGVEALASSLAWMAVLGVTWCHFAAYNRIDKQTRVWLYPGLQAARAFAFAAVAAVTPVGAIALAAHVLGRWFPYAVYRSGVEGWPKMPVALVRLLFFCVLFATLAVGGLAPEKLFSWSSLALIAWIVLRARREILTVWRQARWLPR